MKATKVEVIAVNNIPPYRGGAKWLFIKLFTDEGIVGLGEKPTGHARDLRAQIQLIENLCDRYVIGKDPTRIEYMWQEAYGSVHDFRHPGLDSTPALSAIEIACWDIVGKVANQPIYNLLGGKYHEELRAYAYMPFDARNQSAEQAGEVAQKLVEEGNSACKLDPFVPFFPAPQDYSLKRIRHVAKIFESIRKAVGDDLEVGIGTHGQFSTSGAIRVAHALEEYDPYWFEEPVSPENVDEMARVAAHTSIPIASGERLVTKFEFAQLLAKQAAQIIQLDVAQCGGLMEAKKIAGIAETHYAMIAPHMYVGPIAAAAAVQLDTCSPNFLIQEYNGGQLHQDIFKDPIVFEQGNITPPTAPGLGIELDENVLNKHKA